MFADLDGRLSKPTCASALQSACVEASRHSIRLLPRSCSPVMLRCHASTLLSPAQKITTATHTQQHHAHCSLASIPMWQDLGKLVAVKHVLALVRARAERNCASVSSFGGESHIVELSSSSGHAGVAGQVKRKYDLAMSAPGGQVRALSTLRISARLHDIQHSSSLQHCWTRATQSLGRRDAVSRHCSNRPQRVRKACCPAECCGSRVCADE